MRGPQFGGESSLGMVVCGGLVQLALCAIATAIILGEWVCRLSGSLVSVENLLNLQLHPLRKHWSCGGDGPVMCTSMTLSAYCFNGGFAWFGKVGTMRARALNSFWRLYVLNTTISIKLKRCVTAGRRNAFHEWKTPHPLCWSVPGRAATAWADTGEDVLWRDFF